MKSWARVEGLMVEAVDGEILVYDPSSKTVHALNRTAALVWRHCDGRTTAASMAAILHDEVGLPADEGIVALALGDLERAGLVTAIEPRSAAGISRRSLIRGLGLSGGIATMLPLVESVALPAPAMAQSAAPTPGPTPTPILGPTPAPGPTPTPTPTPGPTPTPAPTVPMPTLTPTPTAPPTPTPTPTP